MFEVISIKNLVVLKYHRRLWANIFDTDISRCINTYIKVVYLVFSGIVMLLQMSVLKILAHRHLWYFKTTKILKKWLQTGFILLHLALVRNVRVKSIWTHSAPFLKDDNVIYGRPYTQQLLQQAAEQLQNAFLLYTKRAARE